MEVYDKKNPGRKPIEVSGQWIEEMNQKEPGRWQVKEIPKQVIVEKKSVVVDRPVEVVNLQESHRVEPPAKKVKSGKS